MFSEKLNPRASFYFKAKLYAASVPCILPAREQERHAAKPSLERMLSGKRLLFYGTFTQNNNTTVDR